MVTGGYLSAICAFSRSAFSCTLNAPICTAKNPTFGFGPDRISRRTLAVPVPTISIACAAESDRSITRLATNGPRSLMRTSVCLPLFRLVTRTPKLKGRVRGAAVNCGMAYISRFEVRRPLNGTPYQDATPSSTYSPGTAGWRSIAGGGPDGRDAPGWPGCPGADAGGAPDGCEAGVFAG